MDLHLIDSTRSYSSIEGTNNVQRHLFLRLKIEGFGGSGLGWSGWSEAELMRKDDMVVASCDISNSADHSLFLGSERLALLGNVLSDAQDSHVVRVWHAYRSVISHNIISGSSITSGTGRHALKLHGPGYVEDCPDTCGLGARVPGTGLVDTRTEYDIISDNIFGASGPWPVAIGPQNDQYDERLSNIIFERNQFHSDYGTQSSSLVSVPLHLWARYCSVRNNIFDGIGSGSSYYAIEVSQHATEPPPTGIEIYHNTIYRGDSGSSNHVGIWIWPEVTNSIVRNNLVSFPYATGIVTLLNDQSSDLVSSNNILVDDPDFVDPDNPNPLLRDFSVESDSEVINQGISVPVFDDFYGNSRPQESFYDIGAVEYVPNN